MFTRKQTAKQQQSYQIHPEQQQQVMHNQYPNQKFTNFIPAEAGKSGIHMKSPVPASNDGQQPIPSVKEYVIDQFHNPKTAMNVPVATPIKSNLVDIPGLNGSAKAKIDNNYADSANMDLSEEDKKSGKFSWMGKKKPAEELFKVDKKLKKKRFNAKLERAMKPKNALLIFNELNLKPEFKIQDVRREGMGTKHAIVASLTVDGQTYTGEATTVSGAKLIAADLALKDIFTKMMKNTASGVGRNDSAMEVDQPMKEESGKTETGVEPLPWSTIGAYALHLLFTRWEVGTTSTSVAASKVSSVTDKASDLKSAVPRAPRTAAQLVNFTSPDKARLPTSIDTSQALYFFNLVCPSVPIVETVNQENPDTQFGVKCQIEGSVYEAAARNKKDARRKIAIQVLKNFGVKINETPAAIIG